MRRAPVWTLILSLVMGVVLPAPHVCGQDEPTSRRRQRQPRGNATPQEELIARKAAALEKPFCRAATWHTDFSAAKAEARRTGRPIFAYFSRSYWP